VTARSYASPADFKKAVEQRLKSATASGTELGRRRQVLVYERFLARVTFAFGDAATLKGGLVLELRVEQARATKDIDLSVTGSPQTVLVRLQDAALRDLGDFMTFAVAVDSTHTPPIALPAPPDAWAAPYAEMARQNRLPWTDLAEVTDAARAFLDPVLGGTTEATWDPASWRWIPR
jgi:hypothetical protein